MTVIQRAAISVHPRQREGAEFDEPYFVNVEYNNYQPDRKTILLLHGYLGSIDDFLPAFDRISNRYNLLAIDLRAHGGSAAPMGDEVSWEMEDLAYDMFQVVNLILPEGEIFSIMASSMATAIALEMAELYGDRVERLFLMSPTIKFHIPGWAKYALSLTRISQIKLIDSVLDAIITVIGKLTGDLETMEEGLERFQSIDLSVHKKILQETLKNWEAAIEKIPQPVFIVAGLHDKVVPYSGTLDLVEGLSRASLLTFEDEEHHLVRRQKEVVFDLIVQWMEHQDEMLEKKYYTDSELTQSNGIYCIHPSIENHQQHTAVAQV